MNYCVIMGTVQKEVEFYFLYKDRRISIAMCDIQLEDETTITIQGYKLVADYMYVHLQVGMKIIVEGKIVNEKKSTRVEVDHIKILP